MRLDHLAVAVLEHQRAAAVKDPGGPSGERGGMSSGGDPVAGGLGDREAHGRLADEPIEDADGVRAAADAGQDEVGQTALDGFQLGRRLVAEDALEVAHDGRIGVRSHRRAEDVVGRLDVGHPVRASPRSRRP